MGKYPKWAAEIKKEKKVSENEVLKFIKKAKLFSTREVMEKFGISQRQALKVLWKLSGRGKIDNVGHGVWRLKD